MACLSPLSASARCRRRPWLGRLTASFESAIDVKAMVVLGGDRPVHSAWLSRRWLWVGIGVAAIVIVAVLAALYPGRVFWLNVMATEGDVPPASVLPLPAGAEIIDENCPVVTP